MPTSSRKKRIAILLLSIAGLMVIGTVVSVLLLRADPSWYQRVAIDPAQQALDEQALRDQLATLHNEIGRSHVAQQTGGQAFPSFEIRITEDQLNGVIAKWAVAPAVRNSISDIHEPHVRFLADRVEIAGRSKSLNSLISIELSVGKSKQGTPTVQLGRPWAGRLPLARSVIDADVLVAHMQDADSRGVLPPAFVEAMRTLLRGDPVDPAIVPVSSSFAGARLLPAKIEKLTIEKGTLVATLRPFVDTSDTVAK